MIDVVVMGLLILRFKYISKSYGGKVEIVINSYFVKSQCCFMVGGVMQLRGGIELDSLS